VLLSSSSNWSSSLPDWEFRNVACRNSSSSTNLRDLHNLLNPYDKESGCKSTFKSSFSKESSFCQGKNSSKAEFQIGIVINDFDRLAIQSMQIYCFNSLDKRNSTGNLQFHLMDSSQKNYCGLRFQNQNERFGEISSFFGHSQPLG